MTSEKDPPDLEQQNELLRNPDALSAMSTRHLLLLAGNASNYLIDQALAAEDKQALSQASAIYAQLKEGLENVAAHLPEELREQLLSSAAKWGDKAKELLHQASVQKETASDSDEQLRDRSGILRVKGSAFLSKQPSQPPRPLASPGTRGTAVKNSMLGKRSNSKLEISRKLRVQWEDER